MTYAVTQSLIEKSFQKIGSQLGDNLEFTSNQDAVGFMSGFIDALQKDAHMNPSQALGFLKYLTEVGYNEAKINKTASIEDGKELDEVFASTQEKIATCILKKAGIRSAIGDFLKPVFQPAADQAVKNYANNAIGDIGGQISGFASKAWDHLKSPEFLKTIAPYAIGALGGWVIPKLLGGGGNGLVNAGLGAAAVGGGAYLANKYKLTDPETWKNFKIQGMNFINGMGGQKQAGLLDVVTDWFKGRGMNFDQEIGTPAERWKKHETPQTIGIGPRGDTPPSVLKKPTAPIDPETQRIITVGGWARKSPAGTGMIGFGKLK